MVNHARTLLINHPRDRVEGMWGEYVDPDFTPRRLTGELQAIWQVLFSRDPDRYLLNWRAHQYLALIHASDFAPYLTERDSRIAYDFRKPLDADSLPWVNVSSGDVDPALTLEIHGTPRDERHRLSHDYTVTRLSEGQYRIRRLHDGKLDQLSFDGSNPIPLFDSGIGILPLGPDFDGASWSIHTLSTPRLNLAEVVSELRKFGTAVERALGSSEQQPWSSFRMLWNNPRGEHLALVGLILAWLRRVEELG